MFGKVLWFDVGKGFGFIRAEAGGADVFVHYSKIIADDGEFRTLDEGERVEFDLVDVDRGNGIKKPQAHHVKRLGGADEDQGQKRSDAVKR